MVTNETNLIKATCKELGLTYKQLGELIGYSEATLNKNASTGEISKAIEVAISLYLETLRLKKELEKFELLKSIIQDIATK
uniref:transcriptional regulator n=1 Tax=Campylobacter fetus TaxID=196 RepID=UPI003AF8C2CD